MKRRRPRRNRANAPAYHRVTVWYYPATHVWVVSLEGRERRDVAEFAKYTAAVDRGEAEATRHGLPLEILD